MAAHFGKHPIVIGGAYVLRDLDAQTKHLSPKHTPCRVRTIELSSDGYIRVGVAFQGLAQSTQVDAQGYDLEPTCFCFPSDLRVVQASPNNGRL